MSVRHKRIRQNVDKAIEEGLSIWNKDYFSQGLYCEKCIHFGNEDDNGLDICMGCDDYDNLEPKYGK